MSTVGFVSYSGYLTGVRDSNRISQLTKLSNSLQVYAASKTLPLPDDSINITASGSDNIIAYQGKVGVDVLETIDYTNGGTDPKDDSYYTYYLTKDRKSLQLMALMEEQSFVAQIVTQNLIQLNPLTNANYEDRIPKVYGRKLGVLTQIDTNIPVNELASLSLAGELDVTNTQGGEYDAHVSVDETISGTGSSLYVLEVLATNEGKVLSSCKSILYDTPQLRNQSGTYFINPAPGEYFEVYCDMETDGGGWTMATLYSGGSYDGNMFNTGNTSTVIDINSSGQDSQGRIDHIWRDNTNRDLMIVCRTDNINLKSYESPTIFYDVSSDKIDILISDDWDGKDVIGEVAWSGCGEFGVTLASSDFSSTDVFPHNGYIFDSEGGRLLELFRMYGVWGNVNNIACGKSSQNSYAYFGNNTFCMSAVR